MSAVADVNMSVSPLAEATTSTPGSKAPGPNARPSRRVILPPREDDAQWLVASAFGLEVDFDRRRRALAAEGGEDLRAHGAVGIERAAVEADDPSADQPLRAGEGAIRPALEAADELGGRMAGLRI